MSIFGRIKPTWWTMGKADTDPTRNQGGGIALSTRETQPLGPWSGVFGQWQPRARSPWLLEALREAIPLLDGGIGRMVTLDGIIEVEGDNDALVQEIEDWMRNVPVNDLECGYQAFYSSHSAEHYEQGVGVGEFIYDRKGRDVVGLRVADSKGVQFVRDTDRMRVFYRAPGSDRDWRPDGLGTVEDILRGNVRADVINGLHGVGYVELDPRQCVFALHKPEADNPYGTSILRSMPFVAQILLKMENASGRAWERFGDPSFHVHYGTKNRKVSTDEALKRANTIAASLAKALSGKQRGNSADLATAAAADDDVKVEVIGAEGLVLEIEQPARHMLEQIVAGFGLAPWMLGITWSQAAGVGEQQSVVVLQESQTRFAVRKPALRRPIEAMLRARGRTWSAQDWDIVQRLPNLMDEQKRAQARFLNAQTALMLSDSGQAELPESGRGIDNNLRASRRHRGKSGRKAETDDSEGEPWAEQDPELPRIEASTVAAMLAAWWLLRDDALRILGLTQPASSDAYSFDQGLLPQLLTRGNGATVEISGNLHQGQTAAWERGIVNAGVEVSADFDDPRVQAAIAGARERMRSAYAQRGLELVRPGIARRYRQPIVGALAAGEFDGQNPVNVAAELRRRFGGGDYNWERLARSEVAMSQSDGKLELLQQQGVATYDYETAGDSRVSRICRELADAGPYRVRAADSPVPVRDSHPNCRCTIRPRV